MTSYTLSSWYTITRPKKHTPRTTSRVSFTAVQSCHCASPNTRYRRRVPCRSLHSSRPAHQDALGFRQPESQHLRILNTLAIHFSSLRICFDSHRSEVRRSKSQTLLPGPNTRVKTLQAAWTGRDEKLYEGADAAVRIEGAFHDNIIDTQTTILL
jgi:hypothetical protein